MSPRRALHVAAVAGGVAAGCASPGVQVAPPPPAPTWTDTGTPSSTVALDREVRYYRDSNGSIWDDRGRKVAPGALAPEGR